MFGSRSGEIGLELVVDPELLGIHAGLAAEAMRSIGTEVLLKRCFARLFAAWFL